MNRHLYRVETNRITVLLHTKLQCLGDCNGVGEGLGSTEKKTYVTDFTAKHARLFDLYPYIIYEL